MIQKTKLEIKGLSHYRSIQKDKITKKIKEDAIKKLKKKDLFLKI